MNLQNTWWQCAIYVRRMGLEFLFSQGRMLKENPERKSLGRKCGYLKDVSV